MVSIKMIDIEEQLDRLRRATLPATYAIYMLGLAESRKITAEQLLAHTNLAADDLYQKNARIAAWQQMNMIFNLVNLTQEPSLSIEIGLRRNLTKTGLLGYALMSCATLRDAIKLGSRFLPIQFPFFTLDFKIVGDMAVVTVMDDLPVLHCRAFLLENFMIRISEIFRALHLDDYQPQRNERIHLYFDYPEPAYFSQYKNRLPDLHFNHFANQIHFPSHLLDQHIPTANPDILKLAIKQGESELIRLGIVNNWPDRVRTLLVCQNGFYPSLTVLADQLHVSERTLKRKLADHKTSYSTLLDSVRLHDAQQLLEKPELSIDEIALRLGYQGRANFTRAFRRWLNKTPSQYREELGSQI